MKAKDVMVSPVVTVKPDAPVGEVARLLNERRISAVPVIEEGRLVGLVSEADLLHRHEIGTERKAGSWWRRLLEPQRSIRRYIEAYASVARDVMTREVVTVPEDMDLSDVAMLLEERGIRRVPVVRGSALVGIVSRSNIVEALAACSERPAAGQAPDDDAIRLRLLEHLRRQEWWKGDFVNVIVKDGTVHFWGLADSGDELRAARIAAQNIQGVRRVDDHRKLYPLLATSI